MRSIKKIIQEAVEKKFGTAFFAISLIEGELERVERMEEGAREYWLEMGLTETDLYDWWKGHDDWEEILDELEKDYIMRLQKCLKHMEKMK